MPVKREIADGEDTEDIAVKMRVVACFTMASRAEAGRRDFQLSGGSIEYSRPPHLHLVCCGQFLLHTLQRCLGDRSDN